MKDKSVGTPDFVAKMDRSGSNLGTLYLTLALWSGQSYGTDPETVSLMLISCT